MSREVVSPVSLEYKEPLMLLYLSSPLSYARRDWSLKTWLPFHSRTSPISAGIRAPQPTTALPSQGSDHALPILAPRAV